jgi:hypothetical protein
MTFAIGVAAVFLMPASAVQTKTWFRPKGWFTDREVKIVVNRVLRDDPSKGDMHNRQAITIRRLWQSLTDYDLWPVSCCRNLFHIITDNRLDLRTWPSRLHSCHSSHQLPELNPQTPRLQHLQHQPPHHCAKRSHHHHSVRSNLAQ